MTVSPTARARRFATVGWLALTAACAGPEASPDDAGAARDAATLDAADAGAWADAGVAREDAGASPDAAPTLSGVVQARLRDDSTVRGEVVAVYRPEGWWDPRPGYRFALFDPARFAPGLEDDSLRLIWGEDVVAVEPAGWARPSYAVQRREAGVVLGRVPLEGPAYVITAHERYHLEENGYGDFAWDLVRTDPQGRRFTGDGADNPDYLVWDAQVFLPTGGVVVEVVRDVPDHRPGEGPARGPSNLVGVNIGGRTSLYLLHFRQGSIPAEIVPGARLEAGAYLGRVGNSGVSLEPHLHVTLLYWSEAEGRPPRFYSVPGDFTGVHVAPSPTGPSSPRETSAPPSGVWISNTPF